MLCNFQSIASGPAGKIGDGRSLHPPVSVVMHGSDPLLDITGELQPRYRVWVRSAKAASTEPPVARPPPTAAQAAAPNRQQNAGMENLIPTVLAKTSPISRLEPVPIHLPTPPAHSGGTVTAGVENCEQTSRLPLFHLVPAGTAAAAD